MPLENALENLKTTVFTPQITWEQLQQAASDVLGQMEPLGHDAYNTTLRQLADLTAETIPYRLTRASMIGMACGAIIEMGGDPLITLDILTTGLLKALTGVEPFVEACHQAKQDATKTPDPRAQGEDSDVVKYGYLFFEQMPEASDAVPAVDFFTRPMLATLCHSMEARQKTKQNADLAERAKRLQSDFDTLGWLQKLLEVLDNEELIVLHPDSQRGYRILISGIGVNFELHLLLMDALIGNPAEGWIAGIPPAKDVVASVKDERPNPGQITVSGQFNLVNWTGLQGNASLAASQDNRKDWIWNEGVPADILTLDGKRIVLIGKPPYARTWNGGRSFPTMKPTLQVIQKLGPEDYNRWVDRILKASSQVS